MMMFFEPMLMLLTWLWMIIFGGFLNMDGYSHMDGFWS